jgi:dTDP-4-amino-4,6-dideoxygalactose transaminase
MDRVMTIARRHGLFVVEDCALAVGTQHQGVHAGLHGDVGVFSFYPVKHMTTAEGGMIIARDGALAARLTHLRAFGVDRHGDDRSIPGIYDVTALGFNYRMSEIEAALGIEQVKRLDTTLDQRRRNFAVLSASLAGIDGIGTLDWNAHRGRNSHYCYTILLDDALAPQRPAIIAGLNARGVGTSVYYPRAIPHMSYYRQRQEHRPGSFPRAARISAHSIALPLGAHLGEDDMTYIGDALKRVLQEVAKP